MRDLLESWAALIARHSADPDAIDIGRGLLAAWAEDELSRLNVTPVLVAQAARLVRMTIAHDPPPGDRDGEVLSDADLAALAMAGDAYRANTAAIRAESPTFCPKRSARAVPRFWWHSWQGQGFSAPNTRGMPGRLRPRTICGPNWQG